MTAKTRTKNLLKYIAFAPWGYACFVMGQIIAIGLFEYPEETLKLLIWPLWSLWGAGHL